MRPMMVIISFFILALMMGLFSGQLWLSDINTNPYFKIITTPMLPNTVLSAFIMILIIGVFAAILFLSIHWLEAHVKAFRVIEFLMIAVASAFVFYSVLRRFFSYEISTPVALIFGVIFAIAEEIRHSLKNVAALLIAVGVGVIFGLVLNIWGVIIFLVLLVIYDLITVYATKDMIKFADFLIEKEFAFSVTAVSSSHGKRAVDLGVGDMIAPVMFEVAAFGHDPLSAIFVFVGAIVGIIIFSIIGLKKETLPALPPIVAGTILAYLIGGFLGFYPL